MRSSGSTEKETIDVVPEGKVEEHGGDHVHATDGDTGRVRAFRIDPGSGRADPRAAQGGARVGSQGRRHPVRHGDRVRRRHQAQHQQEAGAGNCRRWTSSTPPRGTGSPALTAVPVSGLVQGPSASRKASNTRGSANTTLCAIPSAVTVSTCSVCSRSGARVVRAVRRQGGLAVRLGRDHPPAAAAHGEYAGDEAAVVDAVRRTRAGPAASPGSASSVSSVTRASTSADSNARM